MAWLLEASYVGSEQAAPNHCVIRTIDVGWQGTQGKGELRFSGQNVRQHSQQYVRGALGGHISKV